MKFEELKKEVKNISESFDVDYNDVEINITRLYPIVKHQDQNAVLEINIEIK
tara:strand:+ start:310 stop:465 length:156 start_codon:yes stop_codon:yes gene_type:complete